MRIGTNLHGANMTGQMMRSANPKVFDFKYANTPYYPLQEANWNGYE